MQESHVSVATLLPWLTDLVADLGLSSSLVACSHDCDISPEVLHLPVVTCAKLDVSSDGSHRPLPSNEIAAGWRAVKALDSVPLSAEHVVAARLCSYYAIDLNKLAHVRANVVLTHVSPQRSTLEPSEEEIIDAVKCIVPTVNHVVSLEMSTLNEIYAGASVIARALQSPSASASAVERTRMRLNHVKQVTSRVLRSRTKTSPTVAVVQWTDPLYVAGGWVPEILQIAGCRSAITCPGGPSLPIAPHSLSSADIVVFALCAVDLAGAERLAQDFWHAHITELHPYAARTVLVDATTLFSRPSLRTVVATAECMAGIATNGEVFTKANKLWKNFAFAKPRQNLDSTTALAVTSS